MDDLLIATETIDEHLTLLNEVFRLAGLHTLQFRWDKCSFFYTETTYLGYSISEQGIRPTKENVESVLDYPIP